MGEQQTHWETNILLIRTSVKKLHTSKKKSTFISILNICLLLASGQGECKITAYKRDFDAGEDEAGALNGMPLVALSSKNLDGLKKLPYSCDHFFRLV